MTSGRPGLAMRPRGLAGRLFSIVMEAMNERAYARAVEAIAPSPGWRILEIGFGTGRLAELLVRSAPFVKVAGVDPTPDMVRRARGRPISRVMGGRMDLREGSAEDLPWPDRSFDATVAAHSFQFWSDPEESLRTIARKLEPGGRLVLVLRDHARGAPEWLPNPLSRSGDETGSTKALLAQLGYQDVAEGASAGSSRIVIASAPIA
jgi:ubiquinone/menaquinone biosynthesis C-methylase UbiE